VAVAAAAAGRAAGSEGIAGLVTAVEEVLAEGPAAVAVAPVAVAVGRVLSPVAVAVGWF